MLRLPSNGCRFHKHIPNFLNMGYLEKARSLSIPRQKCRRKLFRIPSPEQRIWKIFLSKYSDEKLIVKPCQQVVYFKFDHFSSRQDNQCQLLNLEFEKPCIHQSKVRTLILQFRVNTDITFIHLNLSCFSFYFFLSIRFRETKM